MRDAEIIELLKKLLDAMDMRAYLSTRMNSYRHVDETDKQTLDRLIKERNDAKASYGHAQSRGHGSGLWVAPAPYTGADPPPLPTAVTRVGVRHKNDLDAED